MTELILGFLIYLLGSLIGVYWWLSFASMMCEYFKTEIFVYVLFADRIMCASL